jgi:hypothetical protein
VTALLRGRNRAWTAVTGLALLAAIGISAALGAEHPVRCSGAGLSPARPRRRSDADPGAARGRHHRRGRHRSYLDFLQAQAPDGARRQELERELHEVVAHHATGIVPQAQAARFAGGADPAR